MKANRRLVLVNVKLTVTGAAGEITVDLFKQLVPPELSAEDIERVIDALNAGGIWIVDE